MKLRRWLAVPVAIAPVLVFTPNVLTTGDVATSSFYNSEEHSLVVDRGVSRVTIPPEVTFPAGLVAVGHVTKAAYTDRMRHAKSVAIGAATAKNQDNCYPTPTFVQSEGNKKLAIPDTALAPTTLISVHGWATGTSAGGFSMGQLAAVYGDYRKTTYCDGTGKCYLTNGDATNVHFYKTLWEDVQQNILRAGFDRTQMNRSLCPEPMLTAGYLEQVASGVWPPYRKLGNTVFNLAGPDEFDAVGWYGDEMLRIANINDWHFSDAAIAWYVGMHRLALLEANAARTDPRRWARALHYEANALHSLTDLFALGHVITHRDVTSFAIMRDAISRSNASAWAWMTNVIRMGGGSRNLLGKVSIGNELPVIADVNPGRSDFFPAYRAAIEIPGALKEKHYHDTYNDKGGDVVNLNGDAFTIYGDGKLATAGSVTTEVITNAVRASVQQLFNAHVKLKNGGTVAAIGAAGSEYFEALKYLPVFITKDNYGSFKGMWTTYADAINRMSGVNKTLSKASTCTLPVVSGLTIAVPTAGDACTTF